MKAKVYMEVEYAGEEYVIEAEVDPLYFWDNLGDEIAGLDHDLHVAAEARARKKAAAKYLLEDKI